MDKFKNTEDQNKTERYKYPIIKKLVNKLCGYSNKAGGRGSLRTQTDFLRSRFPKSFEFTWTELLNPKNWNKLNEGAKKTRLRLTDKMKALVDKFTGGESQSFFKANWQELKFGTPIFTRLKTLANALEDSVKNKTCTREIAHLYTNLLACIVTEDTSDKNYTKFTEFKQEGWKFGKTRFSAARKRQREENFTDLEPAKRGRVCISEDLQKKIVDEWIDNCRPAAKSMVTNPNNRAEKRPMLRLIMPKLHIMLKCPFVRTKVNPEGEVSTRTFENYKPWWIKNPCLSDGLCHYCDERRQKIGQIHRMFKETNPEYEYKDRETNRGWHLDLWQENQPKYPTVEQYLKKFDPMCDHPLREDEEKRKTIDSMLKSLTSLERHFRLARTVLDRNRAISKNFPKTLGKNWVRLTHDAKNPLVIGKGGPGVMTTRQKRNLGICSCVGTMVEYADPDGGKKAKRAFAANLSLNTDKTSYATLQHLYESCKQPAIKKVLEDKKHTRLEVTFDNARNYISQEFVYGCTKTMFKKFPHLRLIRWVPLCTNHGKTNLDRRFSSFTSWVNAFQANAKIGSIEQMEKVLRDGIKGGNIRRQEMGDKPIPTSVKIVKLPLPKPRAP